ncbi:class I SAM-dependent methyltransferase [Chloroflexota bacterium]|nr:class I SAM-dependent methyltransferase [Chloroflexota bacterium]
MTKKLLDIITTASQVRSGLAETTEAYRLFNGFYEGCPGLVLDRYANTLVILDHGLTADSEVSFDELTDWALSSKFGTDTILLKQRQAKDTASRNGRLLAGSALPKQITEDGIPYALDLQMNQDAGFYLDTRNLRRWLREQADGKKVLNTFAYTGSFGVAAGVGGAIEVIQTDLDQKFLEFALKSWQLNELDSTKTRILPGDFFKVSDRLRRQERLFDIVILDPPFFSTTAAGRVDWQNQTTRLINKVRPLVGHGGKLVVINNSLFLPGEDFMAELQALCESEYLSFGKIIPIPADITGTPKTIVDTPPADPAPFNHPTKIAILDVARKDKRS